MDSPPLTHVDTTIKSLQHKSMKCLSVTGDETGGTFMLLQHKLLYIPVKVK